MVEVQRGGRKTGSRNKTYNGKPLMEKRAHNNFNGLELSEVYALKTEWGLSIAAIVLARRSTATDRILTYAEWVRLCPKKEKPDV